MVVKETIEIFAPLETVWKVFSRMEDWDSWNDACRQCIYTEGDQMAMNTCFSFVVSPLFFPIRVKPRIVRCDPGKEVVWEGKRFGIHAVHAFRFKDLGTRVVVESEEAFDGFLAAFSRLFGLPERLHRLTTRFMNSLKKASESCRYSPGQGRGHE